MGVRSTCVGIRTPAGLYVHCSPAVSLVPQLIRAGQRHCPVAAFTGASGGGIPHAMNGPPSNACARAAEERACVCRHCSTRTIRWRAGSAAAAEWRSSQRRLTRGRPPAAWRCRPRRVRRTCRRTRSMQGSRTCPSNSSSSSSSCTRSSSRTGSHHFRILTPTWDLSVSACCYFKCLQSLSCAGARMSSDDDPDPNGSVLLFSAE